MAERKVRQIRSSYFDFQTLYKNVVIYCRVSTGLRSQLDSLAAQVSGFVQRISKDSRMRLVDVYIDVRSGQEAGRRSEFQRMLNDAKEKKFDTIYTKSISRFGRNTEESVQAIRDLTACGVNIVFDEEHVNSAEAGSEFLISILSAFAEAENTSRMTNQRWAITKGLQDGTSEIYSRKCYGYRKNEEGQLEIDEAEAEVVRHIFDLYLSGYSIVKIQRALEEEKIPSPTGRTTWSKRSLEKMLVNEKYIGDVIGRKPKKEAERTETSYLVSDSHPAIISREMFNRVQEEQKKRSNIEVDESGEKHRKSTRYKSAD